jgi:hypothetical protein
MANATVSHDQAPSIQVQFRISTAFQARLAAELDRMRAAAPGCELSLSDAIRSLLTEALTTRESKA